MRREQTGLDELRADLERAQGREAALREILQVIRQSRDDELPVFYAVLRNAKRLCEASDAALLIGRADQERLTLAALLRHGTLLPEENAAVISETNRIPMKMDPSVHTSAQAICSGQVVHVHDLAESAGYQKGEPSFKTMVDDFGLHTCLSVPLFDAHGALGAINVHRREPRSFSEDEIALIETFAEQAVIAIEKVRQFREVKDRLEREAATAEVLRVISQSRDDDAPVFDAILSCAMRLCGADSATLLIADSGRTTLTLKATRGARRTTDLGETHPITSGHTSSDAVLTGRPAQVHDARDTDLYRKGDPIRVELVDEWGLRTSLAVPLLEGDAAIGCITVMRMHEVRPFVDKDIRLLEAFAAQAVIAIENVRQFRELQDRTEEVLALNNSLERRVEDQVGEIERMGKLKRFLPSAVADAVVSSGSEKMLSSHRALLGVLFCDIRGFTAFCETAEPEETIEVLQTYHQEMGKLIGLHGAGVDHRMGDGIMVLFNDPLPCADPAGEAVRLAVAMRARMALLSSGWKRLGYRLGFGVGVSLGYATVGMVGFEGRFDYTASGTAVNLAARLCDEAKDGEILLSPRAAIAVEDAFTVQSCGLLTLKGIREPQEVFRLLDVPPA